MEGAAGIERDDDPVAVDRQAVDDPVDPLHLLRGEENHPVVHVFHTLSSRGRRPARRGKFGGS